MSFVRALAARVFRNKRRDREELDIWRLYHFISYRKQISEGAKEAADLKYPNQRASYKKQYSTAHSAVTQQVVSLLSPGATASGLAPPSYYASPDTIESQQAESNFTASPSSPTFELLLSEAPSTENPIPGVQLRGKAWPGTMICFFPGTLYFPPHQKEMPGYPDISLTNPYLMSRTDDTIIDAHDYGVEEIRSNPLAVGHMIRHPPEGTSPNVIPFSYDVDPHLSKELLSLIPNRYYKEPGWLYSNKYPMRTIVMVSMRTIRDEELYLNFRLHPESQVPNWYTSLDEEESERRWKD